MRVEGLGQFIFCQDLACLNGSTDHPQPLETLDRSFCPGTVSTNWIEIHGKTSIAGKVEERGGDDAAPSKRQVSQPDPVCDD